MKAPVPLLSVVVCTRDRPLFLERCLHSLAAQSPAGQHFEILVIDNGTDGSAKGVCRPFLEGGKLRLFSEEVPGLSLARNRGWREAQGQYVAFLDDDAEADQDWCRLILEAFGKVSPQPTAVGGRILPRYASAPPPWFHDSLEIRTWGDAAGFLPAEKARYGFSGGNMAVRRELLEKYGGFSTDFGMVGGRLRMGEDTEFFHRLRPEDRLLWYDPNIVVRHFTPERNFGILFRMRRSYNAGRSLAAIEGRGRISWGTLRSAAGLALHAILLPVRLARGGGAMRYRLAVQMQRLAYRLGYLAR